MAQGETAGRAGASIGSVGRVVALAALLGVAASLSLAPRAWAVFEVEVERAGPGAALGTVTSQPAGIDCGSECGPKLFTTGGKLVATPADLFAGWSGIVCAGGPLSSSCQFAAQEADRTAVATFVDVPEPPLAVTGATAAGPNGRLLTLKGSVNPAEFKVSDCHFEYDTRPYAEGEPKHGLTAPCTPSASELGTGGEAVEVSGLAELEQLKPATTYHYRLVATNFGGTSQGEDRTFATPTVPGGACPNGALRDLQPLAAILLPDCMALELVNSPRTDGQLSHSPSVSAGGGRVRFSTIAALADTPGSLAKIGDPFVATRGPAGWSEAPTSPPPPVIFGWGDGVLPRSFSPDFSCWFQMGSSMALAQTGTSRAYRGCLGGLFAPISPLLAPLGAGGNPSTVLTTSLQGASADGSRLYFSPGQRGLGGPQTALLASDPVPAGSGSAPNTYIAGLDAAGQPSLQLMARDDQGKVWGGRCGARPGGAGRTQGAVSADGSRLFLSTRPTQPDGVDCDSAAHELRILVRQEEGGKAWIGPLFSSECTRVAPPCEAADGDDRYQGASQDGALVYFTTNRQLADSDLDTGSACSATLGGSEGCDLYLYDATRDPGERLIQVSAGETGSGAGVLDSIAAISGDGSHVYFAAQGVLTAEPNAEGDSAVAGQPNLYLYERSAEHPEGHTAFIGTLDPGDSGNMWGGGGTFSNGAYPVPAVGPGGSGGAGDVLLFHSKAALTDDDGDGTRRDVYRYEADSEVLERVSVAAPGAPDDGAFDVTVLGGGGLGTDFAEVGRWVSEDGGAVVLATAEALVPGDANGLTDFYLWREGDIARLPGRAGNPSSVGLSHDGATVAFQTPASLLPSDGNTVSDIYVARVGGGFPEPPPPPPCVPDGGGGCQGAAGATPPPPVLGSAAVSMGNPVAGREQRKGCPKGKHRVRRKGKARCVRQRRAKRKKHAEHRRGRADNERGGRK